MRMLKHTELKNIEDDFIVRIVEKLKAHELSIRLDLNQRKRGCLSLEDRPAFIDCYFTNYYSSSNKLVFPSSPRFFKQDYYSSKQLKKILIELYIGWIKNLLQQDYLEVRLLSTKELALISFNKERNT